MELSFDDLPEQGKYSPKLVKVDLSFDDIPDRKGPSWDDNYDDIVGERTSVTAQRVELFRPLAEQHAKSFGEDPNLLLAAIHKESKGAKNAVSGAGARGYAQFMPATAAEVGVQDYDDPDQAVRGMAKYMSGLRKQVQKLGVPADEQDQATLAAYNYGFGNFSKKYAESLKDKTPWQRKMPKETKDYMASILALRARRYSNARK